jgi:hypothetical protein
VEARYWVVDGGGSAGSLIADLEERLSVEVVQPKAREVAASCGQFYDAVAEQTLSHLDQAPLASALAGAQKRPLGDAWAWARRLVSVDISPLVAVTLAKWGLGGTPRQTPDDVEEYYRTGVWRCPTRFPSGRAATTPPPTWAPWSASAAKNHRPSRNRCSSSRSTRTCPAATHPDEPA